MMRKSQQLLNKNLPPGETRPEDPGPSEEGEGRRRTLSGYLVPHQELFRRSSLVLIATLGRNYPVKFHVRELARASGFDVSMVSKNLRHLEEAGLLTHEVVGNLVLYQADMRSALLRQLKICLTLLDLADLMKELGPFTTSFILYGSCATGEDTDESDIDLFIETHDKKAVGRILDTSRPKIPRTLSPVIQTPDEMYRLKSENPALYNNIQRGIVLKG